MYMYLIVQYLFSILQTHVHVNTNNQHFQYQIKYMYIMKCYICSFQPFIKFFIYNSFLNISIFLKDDFPCVTSWQQLPAEGYSEL